MEAYLSVLTAVILATGGAVWYFFCRAKNIRIGSTFWVRPKDVAYEPEQENGAWVTGDQWTLKAEALVLPFALNLAWLAKFLPRNWFRIQLLLENSVWSVQVNKYKYDLRAGGADYRVEQTRQKVVRYQHTLEVGAELSEV